MFEILDLIDENENIVGKTTKDNAMKKLLLHRVVSAFVFNSKREIFVHKRTMSKNIYPGMYDMTCGGAVQTGESCKKAAKRELKEEVGIKDANIEFLFKIRFENNEDNVLIYVYKTIYDGKLVFQKEEVESGEFMTISNLKKVLKNKKFCPDSIGMFKEFEKQ